jgi:hypothetical protein
MWAPPKSRDTFGRSTAWKSGQPISVELKILPFEKHVKYEALWYSVGDPKHTTVVSMRH